jgi:solute carrier family 25 phosphate transporter 23/24/25/41
MDSLVEDDQFQSRYEHNNLKSDVLSLFQILNPNTSTQVSREELRSYLKLLKLPYTEDHIEGLITRMNANNDGQVSLETLRRFAIENELKLYRVFRQVNSRGDGLLYHHEIEDSLSKLHVENYDKDTINIIVRMIKNGEEPLSFNEWRTLLMLVPKYNKRAIFRYWEDFFTIAEEEGDTLIISAPPSPIFDHSWNDAVKSFCAGALAGVMSRTGTAPMERLKILYQINTANTPGIMSGLANIYRNEGVLGYWRGNGANVIKVAPEKALKFMTFEALKRVFATHDYDLTPMQLFLCGAISGVVTHTTLFPLDVVKTRLAGSQKSRYTGIRDLLSKMMRQEGKFFPFYRGLSAQLASSIPHSGLNLMMYELGKKFLYNREQSPNPVVMGLCGALSTTVTHLAVYPLQVVKARMIMGRRGSVPTMLKQIVNTEGTRGLFKGFIPSIMKSAPSHAITFMVYEWSKRFMGFDRR